MKIFKLFLAVLLALLLFSGCAATGVSQTDFNEFKITTEAKQRGLVQTVQDNKRQVDGWLSIQDTTIASTQKMVGVLEQQGKERNKLIRQLEDNHKLHLKSHQQTSKELKPVLGELEVYVGQVQGAMRRINAILFKPHLGGQSKKEKAAK